MGPAFQLWERLSSCGTGFPAGLPAVEKEVRQADRLESLSYMVLQQPADFFNRLLKDRITVA
jgi:hypothetical protein